MASHTLPAETTYFSVAGDTLLGWGEDFFWKFGLRIEKIAIFAAYNMTTSAPINPEAEKYTINKSSKFYTNILYIIQLLS